MRIKLQLMFVGQSHKQVVTTASKIVTAASAIITTAKAQVPAATTATLTAAPVSVAAAPSKRRKGVVIRDPEEESTTSTIIPTETKSKDKAIDHVKRKAKEDTAVTKYQAMKRKPQTEAQARKNMMIKLDEEVEDLKRYLQIVPNKDDDVYTEATPLAKKKNQRSVHGQAKVKSWKLLESCDVQIITFTTTELILLVERRYPLLRFTLDQMLNAIRLQVDEESEIVNNCKKGLGYESYNAVSPPYTGNFMPSKPDLSFTRLDEFANEPIDENSKVKPSDVKPKEVRMNNDVPIIKEWVSDNEEEDVTKPKREKKTVRPSIVKKEFVNSKP
nr:hypothetical protein [Tanacetum cinerariifolium]